MIDRVREIITPGHSRSSGGRRVSRREREHYQQRLAILGIIIAAALLVLILATGAVYQYLYLPRQTLASVNGVEISRSDYWKMRRLELLNQIQQYSQFAQFAQGQQATQYQQLADQARQQLDTVENDPVNTTTVDQMIDDQVLLQNAEELGVTITDQDVAQFLDQFFSPAPTASPTPTLGVDPTAAAWATATAEAQATPEPTGTPEATATPEGSESETAPETSGTPEATPDSTPEASPAAGAEATPGATPEPTATPTMSPEDIQATATATYKQYKEQVLDEAGMSLSDFRRLVVRPQIARERVGYALQSQIPTRAEQVHAAHILVATEEAAKEIAQELQSGRDFAEVAKEKSADSSTAVNGGDLGWFPRGVMVKPFDDAAFSLQPGEISQPVHTEFGWHIIKVIEREQDRPVSVDTLNSLRAQALNTWLEDHRSQAKIEWDIERAQPTPTPPAQFMPPPEAPPTPTPTPSPEATPGTDGSTPEASPTP